MNKLLGYLLNPFMDFLVRSYEDKQLSFILFRILIDKIFPYLLLNPKEQAYMVSKQRRTFVKESLDSIIIK